MESTEKNQITVQATVNAPIKKVWDFWTLPEHITKWTNASEDWHAPKAENDLRDGGKFLTRMEAKDGSIGFDFEGIYEEVKPYQSIAYSMADGRKVEIIFDDIDGNTSVNETFDPEDMNSIEMQQAGWQAILDNFKKYAEANS